MPIIRKSHEKSNSYVMINKKALEDENLSWGAKGLLAYLISRPDEWNISVSHLSSVFTGKGGGEKAIHTLIKELISCGYCARNLLLKKKEEQQQGVAPTATVSLIPEIEKQI